MQSKRNTPSKFIQRINVIGRALSAPSKHLTDVADRRTARLTSWLLLILFSIFLLLNISYALTVPDFKLPPADLMGYSFLIVSYIISRSRYYRYAARLILAMFSLNTFMNIIQGTTLNPGMTMSFLALSYFISGMLLSIPDTMIYALLNLTALAFLPQISTVAVLDHPTLTALIALNAIGAGITVAFMYHRNRIEEDRRAVLTAAYDETLEGWAKALELRDKETEGHCRRVAQLTVAIARQLGVPEDELQHIYRGALLHDIGKMGIPDEVLRKPGPLSEEDWVIMRQHPLYSYQLLVDIDYLKPALVIPLYHHERWDGSGYPHSLKGDQIPLAARIFALIDIWDALLSDRPYREAWPKDQVYEYLREQSGKLLDPDLVSLFFDLDPEFITTVTAPD